MTPGANWFFCPTTPQTVLGKSGELTRFITTDANGNHAVAAGAVRFEVHRAGHAGFLRTSGTSDPVRCVRVVFSEHGTARQHGERGQDCDRSFHARFGKCHTGKAHQV